MANSSAITASHDSSKRSTLAKLMAEVRQMSRVSVEQEGLLNHAQAAAVLDVSTRRVGELVELGKLTRHDFLGRTYVSVREVLNRRDRDAKPGRPPVSVGRKLGMAAKIVSNYDGPNAVVDALTPIPKHKKVRK